MMGDSLGRADRFTPRLLGIQIKVILCALEAESQVHLSCLNQTGTHFDSGETHLAGILRLPLKLFSAFEADNICRFSFDLEMIHY